jgi:hypothetical protein
MEQARTINTLCRAYHKIISMPKTAHTNKAVFYLEGGAGLYACTEDGFRVRIIQGLTHRLIIFKKERNNDSATDDR